MIQDNRMGNHVVCKEKEKEKEEEKERSRKRASSDSKSSSEVKKKKKKDKSRGRSERKDKKEKDKERLGTVVRYVFHPSQRLTAVSLMNAPVAAITNLLYFLKFDKASKAMNTSSWNLGPGWTFHFSLKEIKDRLYAFSVPRLSVGIGCCNEASFWLPTGLLKKTPRILLFAGALVVCSKFLELRLQNIKGVSMGAPCNVPIPMLNGFFLQYYHIQIRSFHLTVPLFIHFPIITFQPLFPLIYATNKSPYNISWAYIWVWLNIYIYMYLWTHIYIYIYYIYTYT